MTVVDLGSTHIRVLYRQQIEVPDLRRPEYEHLFHDPQLKGLSDVAKANRIEMLFAQYSEQAMLAGMFGNCVGMVRTAIAAGATAQTTIATGSLASGGASGNMDQTPNATAWIFTGHPGASPNQNTYTAIQAFKLTAAALTSLTIASQTVSTAVAAGDAIFVGGSSSPGGATGNIPSLGLAQQLYVGLSTQALPGATQANVLAGEPTSAGGYARVGAGGSPAPLWNNQANWPLPTAASPSILTPAGVWAFPVSMGPWSSGATQLQTVFIADALTLGGGNVLAIGALSTPATVNGGAVTAQFSAGALLLSLT
jgi:hypothetical protein